MSELRQLMEQLLLADRLPAAGTIPAGERPQRLPNLQQRLVVVGGALIARVAGREGRRRPGLGARRLRLGRRRRPPAAHTAAPAHSHTLRLKQIGGGQTRGRRAHGGYMSHVHEYTI